MGQETLDAGQVIVIVKLATARDVNPILVRFQLKAGVHRNPDVITGVVDEAAIIAVGYIRFHPNVINGQVKHVPFGRTVIRRHSDSDTANAQHLGRLQHIRYP